MKNNLKSFITLFVLCCAAQSFAQNVATRPCRTNDSLNSDILFLALGYPDLSAIKHGDFDLANDRIYKNGKVISENYYKQTLGLKYFQPIDKSTFKLPASGWCSWYYYYQDLDMNETLLNTQWLGKNFKDYGLKYIQIDDAWQDKGDGDHDNRDWTTTNKRFAKYGMDSLATFVRKQGFVPALWIVPHGQSNLAVAKKSGAFMLDKNGKSTMKARWAWVGDYQIDPTSKNVAPYFKNLFTSFKTNGYDYFKVDGQSVVLPDYISNQKSFGDPKQDAISGYRNTLKALRESVGKDVFLLGCWRTPVEGLGYFNGSRSNGDVWCSLSGFGQVLEAVRAGYFLHNTSWYVDPDPVMVGSPLTLDMARLWASMIGLTGMSTFCTEKMQDLSPARVDVLKKIFPAQDIYPVDLFRYSKNKSILDLKIKNNHRSYDVVGVFNYDAKQQSTTHLDWEKLGLDKNSYYHVYNFWDEEYVGCFNYGLFVNLNPASCNVFSITKADTLPQLISTNRHITQGASDVMDATLEIGVEDNGNGTVTDKIIYKGKSKVIANDEYKLVFGMPQQGKKGYKITQVSFERMQGKIFNGKGCSYASYTPSATEEVAWEVTFEPVTNFGSPQKGDFSEKLKLTNVAANKLKFNFDKNYGICFGYLMEKNGKPLGYAVESPIYINRTAADYGATYTATETLNSFLLSKTKYSIQDTAKIQPKSITISDNDTDGEVCYVPTETLATKGNLNFYGNGNKKFALAGNYKTLTGLFKVNNWAMHYNTKAHVEIWGDTKLLYKSPTLDKAAPSTKYEVNVTSVKEVSFKVVFEQAESDWGAVFLSDIALIK